MPSPITILYTLIGGLILAGVLAWVRRSRLALLFPKLFVYSHLSQSGQLVELTIFNRGFKTEESIEVSLNPRLSYELVGATAQNVSLNLNKLDISKLGASGDVTLILLVEKGQFGNSDVLSCVSKETTGKLYSSLELIPPTGNQRVIGLIIFLIVPALMLLGFLKNSDVGVLLQKNLTKTEESRSAVDGKGGQIADNTNGWVVPDAYARIGGDLYRDFSEGKIAPKIGDVTFKGKIATVPIVFENKTTGILEFTVSMDSVHSEELIPEFDRRIPNVVVLPGKKVERKVNVVILRGSQEDSDRTVFIDCFVEQFGGKGESLSMKKTFVIGPQ